MWESRGLCEISKRLWKSFWDFHRCVISTASPSLTSPDPAAVPRRRKTACLAIDATELDVHEAYGPIAAVSFHQSDGLAADCFAHKDPLPLPPNLPGLFDAAHLVRGVIPRLLEARRVGAGRRHIETRRRLLVERFMRPLRIEFAPHPIKARLLRAGRRCRGRRRLLLQCQMKPLVAAILLGMAAIDAIELNPEL